jgi:hypothetical protein
VIPDRFKQAAKEKEEIDVKTQRRREGRNAARNRRALGDALAFELEELNLRGAKAVPEPLQVLLTQFSDAVPLTSVQDALDEVFNQIGHDMTRRDRATKGPLAEAARQIIARRQKRTAR